MNALRNPALVCLLLFAPQVAARSEIPGSPPGRPARSQRRPIRSSRCSISKTRPCASACAFPSVAPRSAFAFPTNTAPHRSSSAQITVASPTDPASVRPGSIHTVTFGGTQFGHHPSRARRFSAIRWPFPSLPEPRSASASIFRNASPLQRCITSRSSAPSSRSMATILARKRSKPARRLRASIAVTAVLVPAQPSQRLVVAFGDSVTDGDGSTVDADHNWPSDLIRRLGKTPRKFERCGRQRRHHR